MAQGERTARVAELIQREAARVLLEEAADELLRGATITGVQLSRDLRHARILFTAGAGQQAELERRAKRFQPFLQRELARRVRLRYAVQVALVYDVGVDHAMHLEQVFAEIHRDHPDDPADPAAAVGPAGDDADPDAEGEEPDAEGADAGREGDDPDVHEARERGED
jgi:ribosome-binding factor A